MTTPSFFDLVYAELWSDFAEELEFPAKRPMLAHYTSIQTFERIITNKEFWFSNPLFMNDLEELRFGMNEGAAEFYGSEVLKLACRTDERHAELMKAFNDLFNDFDSNHVLNTYIMCFSHHEQHDNDGRLSMWRGYGNGGSGAAIVVNTEKLDVKDDSPLIIGKVHYGTKAKRLEWISEKIEMLASLIEAHAKTSDDLLHAAQVWFDRLKSFALFSKHIGFDEEQEWRCVYMSERDEKQKFKPYFSHLATNRGVEPKLKLPIKPSEALPSTDLSLEKIIDRIILGPSIASALGVNALKQMMRNIGQDKLAERVVPSDIPFRSTG